MVPTSWESLRSSIAFTSLSLIRCHQAWWNSLPTVVYWPSLNLVVINNWSMSWKKLAERIWLASMLSIEKTLPSLMPSQRFKKRSKMRRTLCLMNLRRSNQRRILVCIKNQDSVTRMSNLSFLKLFVLLWSLCGSHKRNKRMRWEAMNLKKRLGTRESSSLMTCCSSMLEWGNLCRLIS